MRAPKLNRKLVLEEAQLAPDGSGGFTQNWVVKGTLWAAVDAGTGRERAGESVTVSTVGYRIRVRAVPQGAPSRPRPEQRFRDGARLFLISAVAEADEPGHYLTCFAQEEVLS